MKHTQEQINEIWDDVKKGKYKGASAEYQPNIFSDDEVEQGISIPYADGTARELYSRKNESEDWAVVPYVGE